MTPVRKSRNNRKEGEREQNEGETGRSKGRKEGLWEVRVDRRTSGLTGERMEGRIYESLDSLRERIKVEYTGMG